MRRRSLCAILLALVLSASALAQTPPAQTLTETVTVSAREADTIARAVNMLRSSRDPLVAKTVADNIVRLTNAMAAAGRVHDIGPLTEQERAVVTLDQFLLKHQVDDGPIQLQVRSVTSVPGGPVYRFTRSSFIALCADMASTGLIQFRVTQEIKMIVVARMIADLNEQQHELIPEREILEGVLLGFSDQDRKGVIIGRVLDIADAAAASGATLDLVPSDQLDDFRKIGHMDRGVFETVASPHSGFVNVTYGGALYATSVNHFVWFFIRFLLADQEDGDWNTRARRTRLGGQLLDYVSVQLQANTITAVSKALAAAGPATSDGLVLGDFYARGPGLDAVGRAPGIERRPSSRGANYRLLTVTPKQCAKLPELREWMNKRSADFAEKRR